MCIAADGSIAVVQTSIPIAFIAIVTGFDASLDETIATTSGLAGCSARIGGVPIAVIAAFGTGVEDPIATDIGFTVR